MPAVFNWRADCSKISYSAHNLKSEHKIIILTCPCCSQRKAWRQGENRKKRISVRRGHNLHVAIKRRREKSRGICPLKGFQGNKYWAKRQTAIAGAKKRYSVTNFIKRLSFQYEGNSSRKCLHCTWQFSKEVPYITYVIKCALEILVF